MASEFWPDHIKVDYSRGRRKYGVAAYVRPAVDCLNRSRRVTAGTYAELDKKIEAVIEKYYAEIKLFRIEKTPQEMIDESPWSTEDYYLIAGKDEKTARAEWKLLCRKGSGDEAREMKEVNQITHKPA